MPSIESIDPVGVYTVMAEGTPVMPGSPMAWWSQVDLDRVRSITLPGSLHLLRHPVQVCSAVETIRISSSRMS